MANYSRRQLAKYAAQQLADGQINDLSVKLAAALIDSGRSKEADLLVADIRRELEDHGLLAEAEVTSAHQVSSAVIDEIANNIKRLTDVNQVNVSTKVDKAILGGLKIKTANHSWDLSIARRLQTVKEII